MFELKAYDYNGQKVIDSRDVAAMIERCHKELLRSIKVYSDYLAESNFALGEFFIESSYPDANNQPRPCYLITKKGCDMIANKMTGKKGVLFTAAYVTAFEEMRDYIAQSKAVPLTFSPGGVARLINAVRRVMRDQGSTPREIAQATEGICAQCGVILPTGFVKPEQARFPEQTRLLEIEQ